MVSLVRSGIKTLLLESKICNELQDYLIDHFKAQQYDHLDAAFDQAEEGYTLIIIMDSIKGSFKYEEVKSSLIVSKGPEAIFCTLLNNNKMHLIDKASTGPRIIFLRVMGDLPKVIEEIRTEYDGTVGLFQELLSNGGHKGTIVLLTEKPLTKNLKRNDIYEKCLFIREDFYTLLKEMRMHALKYLNMGLGNRDWYELEIRIYDKFGEYKLQYARLLDVIEALELGIVLGESWSKDYPMALMAIDVYRIRLFTFYEPQYIKRILLGLEHLEDGTRIVDYDVYYNRKKIQWATAIKDAPKVRHLASKKYRDEILAKLNEKEKQSMLYLEQDILKTRF